LAEHEAVHQKLDQTYPNILGEFWQFTNVT
jgi:hypothetical protein